MKLSHQLSFCSIALFLLTAFIVMGHNLAQAEEKTVAERLVTINLEDQNFNQALKAVAEEAGITINIHGQIPAGKRDISITNMSLNEAMGHILRIYGVRNHAAAYNPEIGTLMLAILETSTTVAALSLGLEAKSVENEMKFLTEEEFARLAPEYEEEYSTLTLYEFELLLALEESSEIYKTLTQEEFDLLERELPEEYKTLTSEEFNRLLEEY
jgi:hypothetical protein